MSNNFGSKLYDLRKKNNMTLEEVGSKVGVGKSTVRKWETGEIANMRRDKIAKLAEALHTTPAYLMGWEEEPSVPTAENIIPIPKMVKIPLVGKIACGEPILAEENLDGFVNAPEGLNADFALTCKGDSMIGARILDGDIVLIRQQPDVDDGEIAAVLIENEATLKRVHKKNGCLILNPANPNYEPIVITGEELAEVRILGKAVYFISAVK
ncbi:MAG: helix-turn-helix domain-containing protein [Oscillospiraceae bacterium]|nr:helix-turn-helix domain-containing protein [Oscillospiraceae bacterium]